MSQKLIVINIYGFGSRFGTFVNDFYFRGIFVKILRFRKEKRVLTKKRKEELEICSVSTLYIGSANQLTESKLLYHGDQNAFKKDS